MRSATKNGIHISGAEGMFNNDDLPHAIASFTNRALSHERGKPDEINITVARLTEEPRPIDCLPLATLSSISVDQAREFAEEVLKSLGVAKEVIQESFGIINSPEAMRGAAVLELSSTKRFEPDTDRGVRARTLGIDKRTFATLRRMLEPFSISNGRVIEALTLASKVASCPGVLAELCASDNPDYTTGYISSSKYGYVRLPNIKKLGSKSGGRVIILDAGADINKVIEYLQETPVMVHSLSEIKGEIKLSELLSSNNS